MILLIGHFFAKGGGKVRICFHTHAFPVSLAGRAMAVLSQNGLAFGYTPHTDGTLSGAESRLRAAGIDRALVLNIATNPHQEKKVNDFAIETTNKGGFFFAAGSVHPDSTDPEGELIRLKENGVRGIKIHPDYAGVPITDARFDRIFSLCEALGLFVVTHAGPDPVSPNRVFAPPEAVLKVVSAHKNLTLVAAHLGGPGMADAVLKTLVGTNVCLDTSLSSTRPGETETLYKILEAHDPDRLLFGTDTPWTDPAAEVRFVEAAPVSEETKEKLFFRNALRLLSPQKGGEI